MTDRLDLLRRRHDAIQRFLEENVDLLGIVPSVDDVGDGPFMLTDWCLVMHLRDMGADVDAGEPPEVRAAFFRPGMGYSQKLGMIAALDEGVRFPRPVDDDE